MKHDVAHVCVPAGTRNHFAADLGLDREDVVGALDAFTDGCRTARRPRVSERAHLRQQRLARRLRTGRAVGCVPRCEAGTWKRMLPEMVGRGRWSANSTSTRRTRRTGCDAALVIVSNNPYQARRFRGTGTRPRLDTGRLGVFATRLRGAGGVARLVTFGTIGQHRRLSGVLQWSSVRVRGTREGTDCGRSRRRVADARRHRCGSSLCRAPCASVCRGTRAVFHPRGRRSHSLDATSGRWCGSPPGSRRSCHRRGRRFLAVEAFTISLSVSQISR